MKTAIVTNIQRYSTHDGDGVRTTIFFKGCPLSCRWCHNPESQSFVKQMFFYDSKCKACGACISKCPQGAIKRLDDGAVSLDHSLCKGCGVCEDWCLYEARELAGKDYTVQELLKEAKKDLLFYDQSGGGVTLSGGEATLCTEWVGELAKRLHDSGVRVLIETCGFFNYGAAEKYLLPSLDHIYCDIKIYDREAHKKYCGVYNDLILENFRRMYAEREKYGYTIMPRVPLIPGITDTDENLTAIADYMVSCGVVKTDLLPYNPTWYHKTEKLGVALDPELAGLTSWQPNEKVEHAKSIFRDRGIEC